jgi:transcriptional regulator with XRE-family HTH domain
MEIKKIIDRLYDYYNIYTIQDLAKKMGISQPAISKWKSRNSVAPIERKCRELGIYNEIFHDDKLNVQKIKNQNGNNSFNQNGNNSFNQNGNSVTRITDPSSKEEQLSFNDPELIILLNTIKSISENKQEKENNFKLHLKRWIHDNIL